MITSNKASYHEIDFLLPAQKFNIQFSFVNQKGLPFIREFMLRLIHVAPMTRTELSTFFGLSRRETDEAISDLTDRGELTLNQIGKLALTEKSRGYFSDIGESPRLSEVYDTSASLTYELTGFNCIGNGFSNESWKNGIPLPVDGESSSKSESLAEKYFQLQFYELLDKGYLPKSLEKNGTEKPTVYTVNSVSKLRQLPFRLTSYFQIDLEGVAVERDDFEQLKDSGVTHELISKQLSELSKRSNITEIVDAMALLDDEDTSTLFNSHSVDLKAFEIKTRQEEHNASSRRSLLGPVYSENNWTLIQRHLASILAKRSKSKTDYGQTELLWIAPSDPYWGKSQRVMASVSHVIRGSTHSKKKMYSPRFYLPVSGANDSRTAGHWNREFKDYAKYAYGLVEGFLDGNVEVMYLEEELIVVVYHVSHPDFLPVTLPVGFLSTDKNVVKDVGKIIKDYVNGVSTFEKPHDCGLISKLLKH